MSTRIVFMGASGVGGYVGGQLARAGSGCALIEPWLEHVNYMKEYGMQSEKWAAASEGDTAALPVSVVQPRSQALKISIV